MHLVDVHVAILVSTLVCIVYTDHLVLRYAFGKITVLPKKKMMFLHYLISSGLFGMIVTGFFLAQPLLEYLFLLPIFYLKMLFVCCLIGNAFFIGSLLPVVTEKPFAELGNRVKTSGIIAGAVSFTCWIGALFSGILLL